MLDDKVLEIPVLLLKTRSTPHDGYEEYFSSPPPTLPDPPTSTPESTASASSPSAATVVKFKPTFIPVLEHTPNKSNLERLERLLRSGRLKEEYGGMIFTSQRAVEGWTGVVERVEGRMSGELEVDGNSGGESETVPNDTGLRGKPRGRLTSPTTSSIALEYTSPNLPLQDTDIAFPLYVVGPATHRSLSSLLSSSQTSPPTTTPTRPSPFTTLNPLILGAHTGSGAALAPFILQHYNALQYQRFYTFYEAPRLPFTPLVGPGPSPSKTAGGEIRRGGMVRLEAGDGRLKKKKLLFLVGEVRRDVIPKILSEGGLEVEEVEVYATQERRGIGEAVGRVLKGDRDGNVDTVEGKRLTGEREAGRLKRSIVVLVIFSPQGCESVLRAVGYIDDEGRFTDKARRRRWSENQPQTESTETEDIDFLITTIGPTTRDHLRDTFGFEPDICAGTPSPAGVGEGVRTFLRGKGFVV